MKTAKKIISMLLLAVMCVSFMSLTAFAEGGLLGGNDNGGELLGGPLGGDDVKTESKEAAGGELLGGNTEENAEQTDKDELTPKVNMLGAAVTRVAKVDGVEVSSFAAAFAQAGSGSVIEVIHKDTAVDLGTVSLSNSVTLDLAGEEVGGVINVPAGYTLTIQNGEFTGSINNNGILIVKSGVGATTVHYVNNKGTATIQDNLCKIENWDGNKPESNPTPATDVSVSQPNGANYYIFREGQGNSGLGYVVDPKGALTDVYLNGVGGNTKLTKGTHYTYDSSTGAVTLLPGTLTGWNDIVSVTFKFGAKEISGFKIYMFPDNNINTKTFVKGSGTTVFYSFASASKGGYKYGTGSGYVNLPTNAYAYGGGNLVFTNAFLNSLEVGTYSFYYVYSDGMYLALNDKLTVSENMGDISVVEKDPSEWKSGDGDKYFYVTQEPIKSIKIDSIPVSNNLWYDSTYDNYIFIGKAAMAELRPGTHILEVYGKNGAYGKTSFKVAATLKPVTTDKHVTGSGYSLSFVCSDVISKVFVGDIELDNTWYDYYTLSTDGKTVTLKAKFLNEKLVAGSTYTLTVVTANRSEPNCKFQILTTAQASSSPKTGDTSELGLWCAAMAVAATAVVVLMPKLKKDGDN